MSILDDIAQSGIISRDELMNGAMSDLAKSAGYSQQAIDYLNPYNEAGQRALQTQMFISGQMTPQEADEFRKERGIAPGESFKSPMQDAAESALLKRQRAAGISRSGLGLEGFGRLAGELQEKQLQQSGQLADRGLQAATTMAGIRESQAGREATIQERLRENIFNQRQNELARRNVVRQQGGQQRQSIGMLGAQSGLEAGMSIGDIRARTNLEKARIQAQTVGDIAAARMGTESILAKLGVESPEIRDRDMPREGTIGHHVASLDPSILRRY